MWSRRANGTCPRARKRTDRKREDPCAREPFRAPPRPEPVAHPAGGEGPLGFAFVVLFARPGHPSSKPNWTVARLAAAGVPSATSGQRIAVIWQARPTTGGPTPGRTATRSELGSLPIEGWPENGSTIFWCRAFARIQSCPRWIASTGRPVDLSASGLPESLRSTRESASVRRRGTAGGR
jgi:hypothetical protein